MTATEAGQTALSMTRPTSNRVPVWMTRLILVLGDGAVAVGSVFVASGLEHPGVDGVRAAAVFITAYAVLLSNGRMYQARFIVRRTDEFHRIIRVVIGAGAVTGLVGFVFRLEFSRSWWVLVVCVTALMLGVHREVHRRRFDAMRASRAMVRPVVMVGDNEESTELASMFETQPELGYKVVSTVASPPNARPSVLTTLVLAALRQTGADSAVIASTSMNVQNSNQLVRDLMEAGIHVELSSTLADICFDRLTVRPLGRFPVVYVEPRHRHGWRAVAKRSFDVAITGLALAVSAPLALVIAVAIKATSSGPILFRQKRVGRDGKFFDIYKFRTMEVGAEGQLAGLADLNEGSGPLFKMVQDPRITSVGSFLRKTSLDELPQLWNVLRNEMSLVGPRPALASEMAGWPESLYGRLRVKPGITGMWQVSGRSSTSFEQYTRLDLYYVHNWSLVGDLAILAKTVPAVLRSEGAH